MLNNDLNFNTSSFLNEISQKNSFSKEINNLSPNKIPLKLSNKKYFPKIYHKSNSSNNSFSSEKNDSLLKNCLTNELLETINGENSPLNNIKKNGNFEFFNKINTFDKDKTPTKIFNNNNNFKITNNIFQSNSLLCNSNKNNLSFLSGGNLYFNNNDQNQNIENQINEFNYELNFVNYSFNNILAKNYKNLSIYKDCEINNFDIDNKNNNKNEDQLINNKNNLFNSNINKSNFLLNNNNKFYNNNNNNNNNNVKKCFNIKSNLKTQKKTIFSNKNIEEKNGEWICSKCNNLNFYFRKFCNRCNNSKLNINNN